MQTIQIKKDNNIQRYTMRKNLIISALLILSSSYTVMAQEKETDEKQDENIGTQVVNVVKPSFLYTSSRLVGMSIGLFPLFKYS